MGSGDIATNIRAVFNFRRNEIKHKKHKKILFAGLILACVVAGGFAYNSKCVRNAYVEKNAMLADVQVKLEKDKVKIEEEKVQIADEKLQLEEEREQMLSEAEIIAKNNLYLVEANIKLQNSLLLAANVGVTPQNYDEAEAVTEAVDYSKLEYIGEFEGTAYTPSVEECSNNLGYTASGKPIIPGVSVAVDTKYWKLGTKFYIEGLGYVVAMDTGNAVKGKYRFDYAVFDRSYAFKLGRRDWKVYLVKE